MKKHTLVIMLFILSILFLVGCSNKSKEAKDTDNCTLVSVPYGQTAGKQVPNLFSFTSTQQTALSGSGTSDGIIKTGVLENGNSIVWRENDHVFLYIPGEASDFSILHYTMRLNQTDTAISYEDFEEQLNKE